MTAPDAAPTPNYALRQIMLSFAYLAYTGQDITTPNPEAHILQRINAAMPNIPPIAPQKKPAWHVVWGPAVFTMPGALYQDNMMFVVQNHADPTQFVVAVRGTNFISDLDWLMEDLDILQMIPWPMKSPSALTGAQISESTSIDLHILLGMTDKTTTTTGLLDFLQSQSKPINLCVTGHSLGGCVAGTLALYLMDHRTDWDKVGNSTVCSITFAAPTAGNGVFASYSNAKFANEFNNNKFPGWDQTLNTNLDAVSCSLDVAPLAWTTDALVTPSGGNYPPLMTIYVTKNQATDLDFGNASGGFAFGYALNNYVWPTVISIMTGKYQQVFAAAPALGGTFNGTPPAYDASLTTFVEAFVAQARYQHGSSYPVLLGVPELNQTGVIATRRTRRPGERIA